MPTFIAQGRFTREFCTGNAANARGPHEPSSSCSSPSGPKLILWYMTAGDYDWMLIVEALDQDTVVAAAIVATGGGGVGDIKTVAAWNGFEARGIFQKAQAVASKFESAGHRNRVARWLLGPPAIPSSIEAELARFRERNSRMDQSP